MRMVVMFALVIAFIALATTAASAPSVDARVLAGATRAAAERHRFSMDAPHGRLYAAMFLTTWLRSLPPEQHAEHQRLVAEALAAALGRPVWLDSAKRRLSFTVAMKTEISQSAIPVASLFDAGDAWTMTLNLAAPTSRRVVISPAEKPTGTSIRPAGLVKTSFASGWATVALSAAESLEAFVRAGISALPARERQRFIEVAAEQRTKLQHGVQHGVQSKGRDCVYDAIQFGAAHRLIASSEVERAVQTLTYLFTPAGQELEPRFESFEDAMSYLSATGFDVLIADDANRSHAIVRLVEAPSLPFVWRDRDGVAILVIEREPSGVSSDAGVPLIISILEAGAKNHRTRERVKYRTPDVLERAPARFCESTEGVAATLERLRGVHLAARR